jgi:phosphatidylserine synthase
MTDSIDKAIRTLLVIGCAAAAVLVVLVLTESDVEALASRSGGTALAVILLAFTCTAGTRLAKRQSAIALFGGATVLISVTTFVLVMVEIWPDHRFQEPTRTAVMVVISILLGASSLLLDTWRPGDPGVLRLARGAAVAALLVLAVLAILAACDVDVGPRAPGVAAIIFLLGTFALSLLRLAPPKQQTG